MYSEIIILFIIMQNQLELRACVSETRWSHLGLMGDSDTSGVLLISGVLDSLVLIAVTVEILLRRDRM